MSAALVCAFLLAACGADRQHDDDHGRPAPEAEERTEPVEREWPAVTAERLDLFSALLSRGYHGPDVQPLRDVTSAARIAPIVLSGQLVRIDEGRKEFVLRGCDEPSPEGSGGPCLGNPNAPIYMSYVNLGIRPERIWKGSLPEPDGEVYVERPHNVPLDELMDTAPFGARVLVFGALVENARELAEPLEADGFEISIEKNLLDIFPYYGVLLESADGGVKALLLHYKPEDERTLERWTFDGLVEAIDALARQL